jgi:hypothetical protein
MLISITFWTWLWGPVGLVLATPLTACLAVIAKHVPALEFIAVLLGDEPMMHASAAYYERLVAGDPDEAEAIVEEQLRTHPVEHVFDEVLVPALQYVKRDSRLGSLTEDEQACIYKSTREIIERISRPAAPLDALADRPPRIRLLAWPARDEGDAIALLMLQQLLDPARYELDISAVGRRLAEILPEVEEQSPALLCVGFIPPGGLSASRHLSRVLRNRLPDLTIVVGQWGLHDKVPGDREALLAAGATHVTATLIETRDLIMQVLNPHIQLQPVPA